MKLIATLMASLLAVTHALADQQAVERYRNYTPKQIADLPEKTRNSSVPMMYLSAAQAGMSVGAELLFGMQLNMLMYAGLHDYQAAVRAYQADLGDQSNGVLTVWQIHNLQKRSEMQNVSQLGFPESFSSSQSNDYAVIEGTLVIHDDKIADPVNHVRVECYRQLGFCQFSQVYLVIPDKDSWSQNFFILSRPSTEDYAITRWTKDSIDTGTREPPGACRTTAMTFNFKSKEFYYTTRNAGGGNCDVLGTKIPRLSKPRIAQIVDGKKIIADEFKKMEKEAYGALASDFRRKVESLTVKEQKK